MPEDVLINNGLQPCKRLYDEENHVVHTYWVWYWDDPSKDWREAAMEQNRIRDERNALRSHMEVNQVAKNAIRTGKVKTIDLSFMKGNKVSDMWRTKIWRFKTISESNKSRNEMKMDCQA